MMMRRLVRTSHGHASQELLKAAASLWRWLGYRCLILHCGRRGCISCDGRMLWFLRRGLPGLCTRAKFCGQRRRRRRCWWWRNCFNIGLAAIYAALRIAAAAGSQDAATQQVATIRARRGGGRGGTQSTQTMPRVPWPGTAAPSLLSRSTSRSQYHIIRLAFINGQRHIVDQMPWPIDTGTFAIQVKASCRMQATAVATSQG